MDNHIISSLSEFGLNQNESTIYAALLEIGACSVLTLSRFTQIKRSTIYNVIDQMTAKGLVHYEIIGQKKLISAADPTQLQLMLKEQQQTLNNLMPRLQSYYEQRAISESLIKQFSGIQNIRAVYKKLLSELKEGDNYFVISNQDRWFELDQDFFRKFIKQRATLKLNIQLLLQDTPDTRDFLSEQERYHETIKLLPKHIDIKINMIIAGQKVILLNLTDPVVIVEIENKNLVEMHCSLFNLLWGIR